MPIAGSISPAREPSGLRLVPTPRWEPPFDDELPGAQGTRDQLRARATTGQGELGLTYLLPTGAAAMPQRPQLRLVPSVDEGTAASPELSADADATPTSRKVLPDPTFWAGRLTQALLEVEHGVRPASQLRRWLSEEVFSQLRWQAQRNQRDREPGRRQPPRVVVRSVRVCEPADGVAEACAVVYDGPRARAIALRLEGVDGRWRATVVQQG